MQCCMYLADRPEERVFDRTNPEIEGEHVDDDAGNQEAGTAQRRN